MIVFHLALVATDAAGKIIPPRTKKNSPQIVGRMKRPILLPSEAYREWEKAATLTLLKARLIERYMRDGKPALRLTQGSPINYDVNARVLIYRHALIGDIVGYFQAVADFLEHIGVLQNDKHIVSWDGSRMLKDAAHPRYEITLESVGPVQEGFDG